MYIFLDESGDLGFNFKLPGTSRFFVMTMVCCYDRQTLFALRHTVKKTLKRKLNHRAKRKKNELKGSESTYEIKHYFYHQLPALANFSLYSVVLDKKKLAHKNLQPNAHRVYVRLSYELLRELDISRDLSFVQLIADRCKRGEQANEFATTLQNHLVGLLPFAAKVNIEQKSSTEDFDFGLQAVDLFAHGIYRKYEFEDLKWYQQFSERIKVECLV